MSENLSTEIIDDLNDVKDQVDFDEGADDVKRDKMDAYMLKKSKVIGENVRYQRKKRKFNIDNLAECIELSSSYVGLLERGDRCPSIKSLLKLCDLFKVTPNDLLLDEKEAASGLVGVAEGSERSNSYDAVLSLLHGLSDDELEYIATNLKAFRKMTRRSESETSTGVSY